MKPVYALTRGYSIIALSLFVMVVTILAANVNPPVVNNEKAETKAPGDVVVHIVWPNGDIDVDLWMIGPGEPVAVGYSNKGGVLWNLLRDDLGNSPDATPINYEDAFTRGLVPGEYVINVQCFRCNQGTFPMPVDVGVALRDRTNGSIGQLRNLVTTKVLIKADGQEKTAVRFTITEKGEVDMQSVNNVYFKLRGNEPKAELSSPDSFSKQFQSPPQGFQQ